ncbi:MAG: hypothetical protein ACU84J_07945, partial [Gammaproteobacteria bacterium]
ALARSQDYAPNNVTNHAFLPRFAKLGAQFPSRDDFIVDWAFRIEATDAAPTGTATSQRVSGQCQYPGPSNQRLFDTKKGEIIAGAVKEVAEQICGQDILGENIALVCIVTDVFYYVVKAIDENETLCGDLVGRADLTAIYNGLEHVHNDLAGVDAGIKTDIDNATNTITTAISANSKTITNAITATKNTIEQSVIQSENAVTSEISTVENELIDKISNTENTLQNSIEQSGNTTTNTVSTSEGKISDKISTTKSLIIGSIQETETNLDAAIAGTEQNLSDLINNRSDSVDASLGNILQFIAEFRTQTLRLHIEANLADEGKPIASFQSPENYKGYLELVDKIVKETIDRMLSAGESVSNAEAQYISASDRFAQMQYEDAYKWYGLAYRSAVK